MVMKNTPQRQMEVWAVASGSHTLRHLNSTTGFLVCTKTLFKSLGLEKQAEKSLLGAHLSKHIHFAFLMLFMFVFLLALLRSLFLLSGEVWQGKMTQQPQGCQPLPDSQNLPVLSLIRKWAWVFILFKFYFLLFTESFFWHCKQCFRQAGN